MSLIVETIKRIVADPRRSCGYAPQIQVLINSKMGTRTYLLDKEHLPLRPDFEDNTIVMDEKDPSSVQAHEQREGKGRESYKDAKHLRGISGVLKEQKRSTWISDPIHLED